MIAGRHRREFAKAIRDQAWERTADGIYFPRQRALLHGHVSVNGGPRQPNLIARGMLNGLAYYLLTPGGFASTLSPMYVAPWGNNVVPATIDAAIELADDWTLYHHLGEIGSGAGGYIESTRPEWIYADVGGNLVDNSASPAAFTTAATINVYGFALSFGDTPMAALPEDYPTAGGGAGMYRVDVSYNTDGTVVTDTPHENFGRYIEVGSALTDVKNNTHGACDQTAQWYDPSGDDYFDTGAGNWVDPSNDSIYTNLFSGAAVAAIVRLVGAPIVFNAANPLNITWGIQIS